MYTFFGTLIVTELQGRKMKATRLRELTSPLPRDNHRWHIQSQRRVSDSCQVSEPQIHTHGPKKNKHYSIFTGKRIVEDRAELMKLPGYFHGLWKNRILYLKRFDTCGHLSKWERIHQHLNIFLKQKLFTKHKCHYQCL